MSRRTAARRNLVVGIKMLRSRGRPRSFDLDQAVDAAIKLFHARGYDAVGVAELGEALGIKPPSFYAAFGSKAGLLARALERYGDSEANIFARAHAEGGRVADVMDRTLARAARRYPERDGVAGCPVLDGTRNSADPEARAHRSRQAGQPRGDPGLHCDRVPR